MDITGVEGARPAIERAQPTHPSLIDTRHCLGELFGVVNIPNGIWIDEEGVIVRPAEPAWPGPRPEGASPLGDTDLPERIQRMATQAGKIQADRDAYGAALRDWVNLGSNSQYALSPEEVIRRSQPRDAARSEAAAQFELGQFLHRNGETAEAVAHFKHAHRLQPENWTYKRQAWELASRIGGQLDRFWQGPMPGQEADWPYDSDWVTDIETSGAESYYPAFVP